jgi:hypothetical protein
MNSSFKHATLFNNKKQMTLDWNDVMLNAGAAALIIEVEVAGVSFRYPQNTKKTKYRTVPSRAATFTE